MAVRNRLYPHHGTAGFSGLEEPFQRRTEKIEGFLFFGIRMPGAVGITGACFSTHQGTAKIPGEAKVFFKHPEAPLPFVPVGMYRIDITAENRNGDTFFLKDLSHPPGITGAERTRRRRAGKGF
jgi:hypothetical protein